MITWHASRDYSITCCCGGKDIRSCGKRSGCQPFIYARSSVYAAYPLLDPRRRRHHSRGIGPREAHLPRPRHASGTPCTHTRTLTHRARTRKYPSSAARQADPGVKSTLHSSKRRVASSASPPRPSQARMSAHRNLHGAADVTRSGLVRLGGPAPPPRRARADARTHMPAVAGAQATPARSSAARAVSAAAASTRRHSARYPRTNAASPSTRVSRDCASPLTPWKYLAHPVTRDEYGTAHVGPMAHAGNAYGHVTHTGLHICRKVAHTGNAYMYTVRASRHVREAADCSPQRPAAAVEAAHAVPAAGKPTRASVVRARASVMRARTGACARTRRRPSPWTAPTARARGRRARRRRRERQRCS